MSIKSNSHNQSGVQNGRPADNMINEIHMRRKDAADRTSHDRHVHDDLKVYKIVRGGGLSLGIRDRQRRPPAGGENVINKLQLHSRNVAVAVAVASG